jgi:hypothetical protein
MRRKLIAFLVLTACVSITAASAFAHHGSGLTYQMDKMTSVKGTVTKFNWANPHSQLYFDAMDGQHWAVEMGSPGALSRAPWWRRNTLKPGDMVTVSFHPSKSGDLVGHCDTIVLPDGHKVNCYNPNDYNPNDSPETK